MAKRRRRNTPLRLEGPLAITPLSSALKDLGIQPEDWDLLLVGDGSGGTWNSHCGWSCVLVERQSQSRHTFHGGMSCGTTSVSELAPFLQSLLWFHAVIGETRLRQDKTPIKVQIITDSRLIAEQGNRHLERTSNQALWAALETIAACGYRLCWRWLRRDTLGLNSCVNFLARESRKCLQQVRLPEGTSVESFNS